MQTKTALYLTAEERDFLFRFLVKQLKLLTEENDLLWSELKKKAGSFCALSLRKNGNGNQ